MPDGRVKRWERSTGKELEPFYWYKVLTSTSQVSDDRKTSTVIDWDGLKKVRDIATGKELNSVKLDFSVTSNIEISHDGSTIVAATPKGVKIWNASNGKEISVLKGDSKNSEDWTINRLYFSPDDKTIVTGNYIGFPGQSGRKYAQNTTSKWSLKLWNIQTGKTIETFKSQLNAANYVAFSPDNQTIAFAKTDGSIELRDFLTGKAITTLNRHLKQVDLLEFSSDGKMLLSSTDGSSGLDELKLWDLATGQEIKTYKDNIDVEWKIPGGAGFWFDPDGRTILLLDRDNVTTWDLDLENLLKRGCEQVRDNPKAKDLCNIKSIWDL
jgi:WD40 repeat protein